MMNRSGVIGLVVLGLVCPRVDAQPSGSSTAQTSVGTTTIHAGDKTTTTPYPPGNPLFQAVGDDSRGQYSSPAAVGTQVLRRNAFVDIDMRDTLVYCLQGFLCGDSCASLMILNIADPTNPKFVSRLRFHGGADSGNDLKLNGDYVYLTIAAPDDNTLFYVVDVSNPSTPAIAGSRTLPAYALGMDIASGLAFVVDGTSNSPSSINKLQILDITDPSNIDSIGSAPTNYGLDDVRVRNDMAYAVGFYDLYAIDISTPAQPSVLSILNTGYVPCAVALGDTDTLVFIADYDDFWPAEWSAFTVVNVGDPEYPQILCQFPLLGVVMDVNVQDHWAYVSHGSCGLQVFDVTNPAAPDSVARLEVPRFAGSLAVDDTILVMPDIGPFVVDPEGNACYPPEPGPDDPQEGDLLILSIADPANPRLLGFYSPTAEDPTPVDDPKPELLPTTFTLYHNYPNPFNPGTMIEFDLPTRSEVYLTVYNLLGQQVKEVIETQPAGHHTMGLDLKDQASGVYFYELRAGDFSGKGKMLLLK